MGNVLEDEKVLGTCHIAFGDNSTFGGKVRAGIHVDGILLRPTIKLDGKILMKNGQLKARRR
jgi:leucyl aminopeptidase (aminopeptidase T)